jgi:ketosteroid isomerase-like protein
MRTLANGFVFMPPDAPKVSGKNAFTGWAKETFFDPYKMNVQLKPQRVHIVGSQAFAPGSFTLSLTPKAGGATTTGVGKFIHGFKKQKNGSWKYAQVIFNYDKPPA